jgi:hypothetical protein
MTKKFLDTARENSADSSYGQIKLSENGVLIATINIAMETAGSTDSGITFLTTELKAQSIDINESIISVYRETEWQEVNSL